MVNNSQNCMMFRNLFQPEGHDKLFLKTAYAISAAITVTANIAVSRVLFLQKKRTRTENLFLILSMSDIIVGAITIPFTTILFYTEIPQTFILQFGSSYYILCLRATQLFLDNNYHRSIRKIFFDHKGTSTSQVHDR